MFKPLKTQKIEDKFYTIKTLLVNLYVYDTGATLIVFDAGLSKLLTLKGFQKLNLDLDKVSTVFLSHSDYDHVASLSLFKNATIYLSKFEKPMITHEKTRRTLIYNKKIDNVHFLEDKEIVNIDDVKIQMISTPGHTVGSALYIVNDDILIAGDTISITSRNEINHFSFIQNMDHKNNIKIVKSLHNSGFFSRFNIIASGHYGVLNKNNNKK
jgi:glyoxylase-like metal-dependent hydrolase (beta-lactamase superfamily II)